MFYEPEKNDHGLPHNPFKSCCIPRPIGWISTLSPEGKPNLAPFSQFQNLTFDPPYVMFSANQRTVGGRKDSVVNAEATGEFVWNMATYAQREAVNISAMEVEHGVDEFELAKLEKLPSELVKPWRIKGAPVHFECRYHQTVRLPGNGTMGTADIVIGEVIGVHIADDFITDDGRIDVLKARPIARLGYYDYTSIESTFEMVIPGNNEAMLIGLEGKSEAAE
jgi:flavin reductase (DIM6/NTAB) family NADH-FMN oxidoreductase RutF